MVRDKVIVFASSKLSGGGKKYLLGLIAELSGTDVVLIGGENITDSFKVVSRKYSILRQLYYELRYWHITKIYISNKIIIPTPRTVTIWQNSLPFFRNNWESRYDVKMMLYWIINMWSFFWAVRIVVLSEYWKNFLLERDIGKNKIFVKSNLVNSFIGSECIVPQNPLHILLVTSDYTYKGNDELLVYLKSLDLDLRIDVAGIEGKCDGSVFFHGWCSRSRLKDLMYACDIVISNSYCENSPYILQEVSDFKKGYIARDLECLHNCTNNAYFFTDVVELSSVLRSVKSEYRVLQIHKSFVESTWDVILNLN